MSKPVWALLLLLATTGALWAQVADLPVVSVPPGTPAPVIDGKVDAAEWSRAAVLSDFVLLGSGAVPTRRTVVYFQYDSSSIYMAALCAEPKLESLVTKATERDGPVLQDDSLELVIDTMGTRQSAAHLAVSAAGVQYDAYDQDVKQGFKWTAAAGKYEGGWTVELALPFANGVGPEVGDTWLVNFGRNVPALKERSAWAPMTDRFDELKRLGTLVFSTPMYRVKMEELGFVWLGQNVAQFEVQSLSASADPLAAKLNARVTGKTAVDSFFNAEKIGVRQEAQTIGVPYRIVSDGAVSLVFSLTDARGQAVWRTSPYRLAVPEVSRNMKALEASLSAASVAWGKLPVGAKKEALGQELGEVLTAWRSLDARYRTRETMSRSQYEALGQEADFTRLIVENLKTRMV